jgi:hypothetical protein
MMANGLSSKVGILAMVSVIVSFGALAQDFPYKSFERSTLGGITAQWDMDTHDSLEGKRRAGSEIFIAKIQRVVVRATYRGPHRPIARATVKFLQDYGKAVQAEQSFAGRYEEECLFGENDKEYWLPVQKSVAAYFDKELKPGELVDLYAVGAGGVLQDDGWKWVFPVEEFNSSIQTQAFPR